MKKILSLLLLSFFFSCAKGKESTYTGSTPADVSVRSFLSISDEDSVDFIRWQLIIKTNSYNLHCNYGIGKANTKGFIDGGKTMDLSGSLSKERNYYHLHSGDKILRLAEVNANLLHVTDANNNLLVGNGGWSYTLNNVTPINTNEVYITAAPDVFKDSLVFYGRTPCNVPGIIPAGRECYKIKWAMILYADKEKKDAGTYRIKGTPWRKTGDKTGNWQLIKGKNDRFIYRLNDDNGNGLVYLLKVDENILVFTDADGKLLVGNEDFSYTMNCVARK